MSDLRVFEDVFEAVPEPRSVALGTFDGVHLGHRAIVEAAAAAAGPGERACAATIHPRPASVLGRGLAPEALCTIERRVELLADAGAQDVAIVRFSRDLSQMPADVFAREILVERLGARHVAVGANFGFGRDREGTPELLLELGRELGFAVEIVPLILAGGQPVSSSRIRSLVAAGHMDDVTPLLGRPFSLDGFVVRGDGRGRQLGFPTANVARADGVVRPAEGVYAGVAVLDDGRRLRTAVSVGTNPTFAGVREVRIEAHLIDFDEDLYGRRITVEFHRFLRGQVVYTSLDDLIRQIQADIDASRR